MTPRSVFFSVNMARLTGLRKPLRWDKNLAAVANARARTSSHTGTHSGGLGEAISGEWYKGGEALAWVYNRENPVPLWIASREHRRIVLGWKWTHGGVGIERTKGMITIALVVADRSA